MTHDEELEIATSMSLRIHELIKKIHEEEEKKHGEEVKEHFNTIIYNSLSYVFSGVISTYQDSEKLLTETFSHLERLLKSWKENG